MITPVPNLEYGTAIFIINKKDGTVKFIMNYQKIDQKITRKPYPLPIIGDTVHQLEVFQYATALDLNVVYFTIDIFPESCDLTTIVTEFGKLRYNRFPMGICVSINIFQDKLDELLSNTKSFKRYINYILVFGKGSFSKHKDHLSFIFAGLCAAGIKVNYP